MRPVIKRNMRKTFKYRLLGSKTTFANAEKWLDLCRNLYNAALEERITAYKTRGITLSCYDQMKELPGLKKTIPDYRTIDAQVLQTVLGRLDDAYKSFFRRLGSSSTRKAGFPRFKGRSRYDGFTLKQNSWKLDGKYLLISRVGKFKLRLSRPIQGTIKTITIRKSIDKWYTCFSCNSITESKLPESGKVVGIDVGIKSFATDSNNNITENPTYLRRSLSLLRRRQRRLRRRVKESNRRQKSRVLVTKVHEKVKNQRSDFLHKVANHYVQTYGMIAIENLNISGMVRNHRLAQSIQDVSWSQFIRLLEYKAEEAGRQVIKIPRFEPTSKTCSECGAINTELKLSDRQWVCQSCGMLHDRDYNAAKNILRVGQTLQAQTCGSSQSVACESPEGECQTNSLVAT